MFNTDEIYPVSNFLQLCNKTINQNIPNLWISGELSNLSTPSSRHIYFSIKDQKSQIKCAFFRLSQRNLKFKLENGLQIMVYAGASIYEMRGDFQLIVNRVEVIGIGSLELGFEQLKTKLLKEGLFDKKHKKPLPTHPEVIGVIGSYSGAVIEDIKKVLLKRYPFAEIILYDTPTQGDFVVAKIITAIQTADADGRCDVLIVARGGGSREDLWAFNDEDLARVIFSTKTPVISSIGHETDTTIIDFVSDKSAPTPSVAAMLVSPDKFDILQKVIENTELLQRLTLSKLKFYHTQIRQLQAKLSTPDFTKNYQYIDDLLARLKQHTQTNLALKSAKLNAVCAKIKQHSPHAHIAKSQQLNKFYLNQISNSLQNKITHTKHKLNLTTNNLHKIINNIFLINKQNLHNNVAAIHHLSPLKTLSRGYSITSIDNKVVLSNTDLKNGDIIYTKLENGIIVSKVIKTKL